MDKKKAASIAGNALGLAVIVGIMAALTLGLNQIGADFSALASLFNGPRW